ncbi:hypothetical protein I5M32_11355 [Pedobacter sp. SD-b]|uniref:HTH cro/C1-type domain-containing protein n=1 Tax=Pedobacter segetis TaxID=2793069 RepID=A0ABS1BKY5_9SPHI|nr:hypothetical protein [Pedobacter segetis]MBK0383554.1 hypothetical protein [Pedobacter segetis]
MKNYKYRINEMMENLPIRLHRKASVIIPKKLNVSTATFSNYRNIQLNDIQDIPYEKVIMLEKLFSLKHGSLQNFTIDTPSIEILLNQDEKKSHSVTA